MQTACLRSRNLLDDKYSIFCSCPTSSVSIRACGVVVSRIVCIDKVSGSNPDESNLLLFCCSSVALGSIVMRTACNCLANAEWTHTLKVSWLDHSPLMSLATC